MQYRDIFDNLFKCYGPQHWWPGDTPFEVMVGAILTQNTAWTNVEKAIKHLKDADCLDPHRIVTVEPATLAGYLRPSGYFNIKAQRLRNFCQWYIEQGQIDRLSRLDDHQLRRALLGVNGIGPETADDMVLYAFERPIFVVDAYTKRLFSRLGMFEHELSYHAVQELFHQHLDADVGLFNEYHALIVIHCKDVCKKKPLCEGCCLRAGCQYDGE